jgi:uncharacterized protein YbaP (TraB family)
MRHPRRSRRSFAIAFAVSILAAAAPASEPAPQAPARPLLWRIEGEIPSYVFGTIHLPDARVLALPAAVEQALDGADVLFTEIPFDAATLGGMAGKVMLPPEQDLKTLAGEEVFARFVRAFKAGVGSELPEPAAAALAAQLARMKPWAAMAQLAAVDYLPELLAGAQPLDVTLHARATAQGKQTGALETVDEQIGYFEALTTAEQVRLLACSLDELDEARSRGASPAKQLVEMYLQGDTEALLRELTRYLERERELKIKFLSKLVHERNAILAERIAAKRTASAGQRCFFAVGALHLAGEDGIPALLARKGLRTTRVEAVD